MKSIARGTCAVLLGAAIALNHLFAVVTLGSLSLSLRHAAPSWQGRYVRAGNVRIHYIDEGSGPPLVLVHGFGAWSFSWRKNIKSLSSRYRVLAIDLKGFGLSDKPSGASYSLDAQADLLRAFMDRLGIDRAVVAGNSIGGEVALRLYAKHPDKVQGIVLLNSTGYQSGSDSPLRGVPEAVRPLFARGFVLTKWVVKAQLASAFADPEDDLTEEAVDGYYYPFSLPGAENACVGAWKTMRLENQTETARSLRVPALIIWGEDDRLLPASNAFRFDADIPDSRLMLLKNTGHSPQEERPAEVNRAILEFGARLAP
ncbi:MAG: alpha/beta fold hydrolase [Candidatus Aquicultorales bacterium]